MKSRGKCEGREITRAVLIYRGEGRALLLHVAIDEQASHPTCFERGSLASDRENS